MRCKADVLASGAVLVDLPGVGDANAARESVAKEYGKAAHMVFAAPIGRAVSDKLAKSTFSFFFLFLLFFVALFGVWLRLVFVSPEVRAGCVACGADGGCGSFSWL